MTRKIISIALGVMALYVAYIGVQFYQLQIQQNYDLVNVTTFFSFFFVFLVLLIVLYEWIEIDRFVRWLFIFITIVNLNYFFITFFLNMITVAEGSWAGEIHNIQLLFFTKEFSVATLIEYNVFFRLPMILNAISAGLLVIGVWFGRKR